MWDRGVRTTLGECADWISGGTPSMSRPEFWTGDIPWVSAKDMKSFRLYDTEDHVTLLGSQNGTKIAPAGSILVLVRGMTLHNDLPICMVMRDMAFNQDVKAIIPRSGVRGDYLAYWLLANKPSLMALVDSSSHGRRWLARSSSHGLWILM
jgi:type I restriction enzyme, S subunit